MKRRFLPLVIGLLSFVVLAVGLSVIFDPLTPGVQAKSSFVVDNAFYENIPGPPSIALDEGTPQYSRSDVFREGTVGSEPPIGTVTWSGVATKTGDHGGFYSVVYEIFGEGQIHLSVVFDPVHQTPAEKGAIIGGTGRFRRA